MLKKTPLAEGKALLASLQEQIVTAQVQQHVANIKPCPRCGKSFRTKGYYHPTLRSVYGRVDTSRCQSMLRSPSAQSECLSNGKLQT
jgi:hypothetical protein